VEVVEVGLDQVDESRGDEDGNPLLDRHAADSEVFRDVVVVQFLRSPCGDAAEEAVELQHVPDVHDLADIAFDVGLHVGRIEALAVDSLLEAHGGHGAPEDTRIGLRKGNRAGAYWISSIRTGGL
jgi:hypothetical protein